MSAKPLDLTPEESRQWDQTVAFEMGYCRHYEPKPGMRARDLSCAVGIDTKDLPEITDKGKARFNIPCIDGHLIPGGACAICPKWERHTKEDGEKRATDMLHSMRKMKLAGPIISAWREKKPRGKREVIECPVCKGRLHLSQAAYNGHVHGRCETDDCLSWLE